MSVGPRRSGVARAQEPATLAAEQAALRRVATLVARAAPSTAVFAAVAEEVGGVLAADFTMVGRYDADGGVEVVGGWSRSGDVSLVGRRMRLGGTNVSTLVFERHRPARVDRLADDDSALTAAAQETGMHASAGAPISVDGRLWGVMIVATAREHELAARTERRLADFTDLVATAIANAQAREELRTLAGEQAALRRVAMLVARGEPPAAVFTAVAEEVGRLLSADLTLIGRYDPDGTVMGVGGWDRRGEIVPGGTLAVVGGRNVTTRVFETCSPARIDAYDQASGEAADDARNRGIRSAVGAPITVAGRLWGVMIVAATRNEPLPAGTEARLAGFTELVATAIANAEAREALQRIADEQAALRRVATLVARGVAPADVLTAVTEEVGSVLAADAAITVRLDADGLATVVARVGDHPTDMPVGSRWKLEPPLALGRTLKTGGLARADDYTDTSGGFSAVIRTMGIESSIAVPIVVNGRLWGAIGIGTKGDPFPTQSERRMVEFTELVASAIANAEAQAALTASRARIVATADETRRRIERDLHDGAQQRLVSVALQLRGTRSMLPPELAEVGAELDGAVAELTETLDELRELARGIHPAVLAERGLPAALRTLARRSPVRVDLTVHLDGRLPEPIEVCVYYVVSEALTNAVKHARASAIATEVRTAGGEVRVCVRDDGSGGARVGAGSGLLGLKDRVEALGGRMSVDSRPGAGTSLRVNLPLAGAPGGLVGQP